MLRSPGSGGGCGQRLAGTSGRDELADAGRQALGHLGHQAAFDGLTGDLGHGPDDVGGVRLIEPGAFGSPGGEVLAAGPLAGPGPGVDLGAPQRFADLVRGLGSQVGGQSLGGGALAEGLQDPAGGALGVAAASRPGPALRLAGELVVLRLILLLARVCGTVRLRRMSHA